MTAALTPADALTAAIAVSGPIPVQAFMLAANRHYYAMRDPLGAAGDFTTAPEISQMFGELVGLAVADLWDRAGRPDGRYVELGPGRGTLAADALRAMAAGGLRPEVEFVETSPVLRARQEEAVPDARFHDNLSTLPDDRPLLMVANEFFDALPVAQIVKAADGWRERRVAAGGGGVFVPVAGPSVPAEVVPAHLIDAPPGSIVETAPAGVEIARAIGRRLMAQGGAALIIDYGYAGPALGDTLQAVAAHAYANPFEAPGERDLTAHVDFATLAAGAQAEGAIAHGPVDQGDWLEALGLGARATALSAAHPPRAAEITAARERLVGDGAMGRLFKVLAITAPGWPAPAGFGA